MSFLLVLLAVFVLVLAHFVMPRVFSWLRVKSRLAPKRPPKEEGLPASIMGNFERIMAAILVAAKVPNAYALLAAWLGAKLAASWQRLPLTGLDPEGGRKIRAGTQAALIAGIISVGFGVIAGLIARCAIR